jgi:MFS transporter, putative metabolite:H+ symporter
MAGMSRFREHVALARGYPLRAFTICLCAYALSQMDLALFGYALKEIRREFGVDTTTITYAIAAANVIGGLMLVGLGVVTDRVGRRSMLMLATLVSSVFIVLHAIAPSLLVLALLRGMSLGTGGLLYPATGAIVTEEAPARLRGLFAGMLQAGYPLGWFLGSVLAATLMPAFGWRVLFVTGLISIPFVWVIHRHLRESSRFLANHPGRAAVPRASVGLLFKDGMARRTIILFAAQFMFVVAYGGTFQLFPLYFHDARGFDVAEAAFLVGLGNLVAIGGYALAAWVGEFVLTRRTTVVIWTLAGSGCFVWLLWGTTTPGEALLAFSVMCVFFLGVAAVKFAFVAELFPTHLRATGLAFCGSLAVTLGSATGPLLIGWALRDHGWDVAFSLFGALPLFLAGLMYLLLKPVPSGLDVDEVQRHLRK